MPERRLVHRVYESATLPAGADREYDTESTRYTYTGRGGVSLDDWFARTLFAVKFAERNFLLSNVIGDNSKILFNRDPAKRVQRVAQQRRLPSAAF